MKTAMTSDGNDTNKQAEGEGEAAAPSKRRRVDDVGNVTATAEANAGSGEATPAAPNTASKSKFQVDKNLTNQNKKDGIPPWRKVQESLLSEESVAKVLIEKGIIKVPTICPKCHQSIKLPKRGIRMRCKKCYSRNGGEWSQSLLKGTFFEFGRLKVHDMLMFLYHWLCGAKHKQLCLLMGWSNSTMFRWVSYAQDLVAAVTFYDTMDASATTNLKNSEEKPIVKIGGQDVVVQIEQCSFDKRHCQHPSYVKGGWIFCGVECTPKRRFFSCVVADQNTDKWMVLVRKHIAAGSIIKSHNWSNTVMDLQPGSQYRLSKNRLHNNNNSHNPLATATATVNPQGTTLVFDTNHFVNPFQQPLHHDDNHHLHHHHPMNHPAEVTLTIPPAPTAARPPTAGEEETWIVLEEAPVATNGMAPPALPPTRKHNNVKELQGSLFEFIWRKKHEANLWNALLWTIKEVKYEL